MVIFEKISVMEKQIYNNNLKITYKIAGEGNAVVLVHGFLETSDTWTDFAELLSENCKVISLDLPGHGGSELHEEPETMCKYAESIYHILNEENIFKAVIVGHSMGGYVALAFAENYAFMLSGLCLFHSSPFADNEIKKQTRLNTVQQTKEGNKDIICSEHAKAVYADDNIERFKAKINEGKRIALSVSEEGVIASLLTMKDRKDRNNILENLQVPFLYILGKKDRFIPETVLNQINMPRDYKIAVLENSGHMGMIEEKEKSLNLINDFCKKIYKY